jgi:hypothetical protein
VSFDFSLRAVDAFNNLVDSGPNDYNGSRTMSYANSTAGNAPDTTPPGFPSTTVSFTNGASGTLSATYYNAATGRTVRADDTGTPVTGTASSTFTVQANDIGTYFVEPAAASQTAGVSFNVTISAADDWENAIGSLYSPPSGTYTWTTNAQNAPDTTAPSIGTLSQSDFVNGVATKSVTLYRAESGVTFTANEPSPSTVGGTSATTVTVVAGAISAHPDDSTITGPATVQQNVSNTYTVTLRDTWRNPKSGVNQANIIFSAGSGASITQPTSATNASGQTTASIQWSLTGNRTVLVEISGVTLVQNDGTTPDADGFLDDTLEVSVVPPTADARIRGGATFRGGSTNSVRIWTFHEIAHDHKKSVGLLIALAAILIVGLWLFLPAQDEPQPTYVAVVNQVGIPLSSFDTELQSRSSFYSQSEGSQPDAETLRRDALSSLIEQELVRQYAVNNNITVSDEEVLERYNARAEQQGSEAALLNELQRLYGTDKASYIATLRQDILREKVVAQLSEPYGDWLEAQRQSSSIQTAF